MVLLLKLMTYLGFNKAKEVKICKHNKRPFYFIYCLHTIGKYLQDSV